MNESTNKWNHEWMNELGKEWMNGWMNKWMNEWRKEQLQTNQEILVKLDEQIKLDKANESIFSE